MKYPIGPPIKISLQINNCYMHTPFYVPLRTLDQNNGDALAAAFLQLARQSGGKFKLFSTCSQLKIYGVWPLDERKERKSLRHFHFLILQ